MLTREGLHRRLSGAPLWALPWGLAAACALPWLLPETWNGVVPKGLAPAGWMLLGGMMVAAARLRSLRGGLAVLALALPWWTFLGLARQARADALLPLGVVEMEGRLSDVWEVRGLRRRNVLRVEVPASLKGRALPLYLPEEGAPAPPPGSRVRFTGELRGADPAPAFLGERPLWRARSEGTLRRIHLRSALQFEALGPPEPSLLLRLRGFLMGRLAALPLPEGPARDLWGAVTLGIPPVSDEVVGPFLESGTIHTLVVSGLQVTLVMVLLESLVRRLLRRGSTAAALGVGLLYAAVVGFSAPVWRGLLMGSAWVLGRRSGWRLPPVATLHGALALWLLAHPASGADPGFLLAWFALVGLLWAAEPLAGLLGPPLGRWALPAAHLAAPWFTTLPLLALLHGGAPAWGILANALVLPLLSLLTPVCLLLTLLPVPFLVRTAGEALAWTGGSLLPPFARIQPLATGWLPPWLALLGGWIALAQAHAAFRRTRALTVALVGSSLVLVALRGTGGPVDTLTVEAVDVGQGDALLVRVPGGPATLVDTGPSPWAGRRLARALSRRGVREPVELVLTHPHGDHVGGWAALARLWPVEHLRGPVLPEDEDPWAPFRPRRPGPELEALRRGEGWSTGAARFEVRWPPRPLRLPDANATALVLRVIWRDWEAWLMGDAEGIQERDLLDLGDPPPLKGHRLLKPGHHGGRRVCDPAWIGALRPDVALITAGRENRFGFPAPETVEILERAGCRVLVTGPAGGWRVEARPGGWNAAPGLP